MPDPLPLVVPLRGKLEDPQLDIESALIQTVLQNLSGSLGTILRSTTVNGKKLDGETIKQLGDMLKNWK
jgi:hypothetical protein